MTELKQRVRIAARCKDKRREKNYNNNKEGKEKGVKARINRSKRTRVKE